MYLHMVSSLKIRGTLKITLTSTNEDQRRRLSSDRGHSEIGIYALVVVVQAIEH